MFPNIVLLPKDAKFMRKKCTHRNNVVQAFAKKKKHGVFFLSFLFLLGVFSFSPPMTVAVR